MPEELFHKPTESVIVDSNNELVLRSHLVCAAAESPLEMTRPESTNTTTHVMDMALFGGSELYQSQIDYLANVRVSGDYGTRSPLVPGPNGTWIANPGIYLHHSPARDVSLRIIDPISFEVINDSSGGILLDHVEYSRAFFCLFEVLTTITMLCISNGGTQTDGWMVHAHTHTCVCALWFIVAVYIGIKEISLLLSLLQ